MLHSFEDKNGASEENSSSDRKKLSYLVVKQSEGIQLEVLVSTKLRCVPSATIPEDVVITENKAFNIFFLL